MLAAVVLNRLGFPFGLSWDSVDVLLLLLLDTLADLARASFYSASTPSAHESATAGTSVVDSTKVAPLEPEKGTYA